jgi:hypothetical protein
MTGCFADGLKVGGPLGYVSGYDCGTLVAGPGDVIGQRLQGVSLARYQDQAASLGG